MPTTTSTRLTNSAKLSAVTTPKLAALRFHSSTEATPAPTRPMIAEAADRHLLVLLAERLGQQDDQARQRHAEHRDDGVEVGC